MQKRKKTYAWAGISGVVSPIGPIYDDFENNVMVNYEPHPTLIYMIKPSINKILNILDIY